MAEPEDVISSPPPRHTDRLAGIPEKFADPDPGLISKLPKGKKGSGPDARCNVCRGWHPANWVHLDYVGHGDLTLMLLAADPEWDWRPAKVDDDGAPVVQSRGGRLVMWGYLKVCGKERMGVGTCPADQGEPEKELIGDFLRNAAMRFGFCTKLWSKTDAVVTMDDGAATDPKGATSAAPSSKPAAKSTAATPANQAGAAPAGTNGGTASAPSSAPKGAPLATPAQVRDLAIAMTEYGLTKQEECIDWCNKYLADVNRSITTRKELTQAEVKMLLGKLEQMKNAQGSAA